MSAKYAFIDAEKAEADIKINSGAGRMVLSLARMCVLLGVSRSGFYEWLDREVSDRARRREILVAPGGPLNQRTGLKQTFAESVAARTGAAVPGARCGADLGATSNASGARLDGDESLPTPRPRGWARALGSEADGRL